MNKTSSIAPNITTDAGSGNSESSSGFLTPAVIGVTAGVVGLLVVVAIVLGVFCYCQKRKQKRRRGKSHPEAGDTDDSIEELLGELENDFDNG